MSYCKEKMEKRCSVGINAEKMRKFGEPRNMNIWRGLTVILQSIMPIEDPITPAICPTVLTGSLLRRYGVVALVEDWIGFCTVRRSFMIIFIHSLKGFKPRLEDIVG